MLRDLERRVQQRHVLDDPLDLDAARRGDHQDRPRVVDPRRQLAGREAAEDHRVDGADAGVQASIASTASGTIGM